VNEEAMVFVPFFQSIYLENFHLTIPSQLLHNVGRTIKSIPRISPYHQVAFGHFAWDPCVTVDKHHIRFFSELKIWHFYEVLAAVYKCKVIIDT
jgi:hypothetical protein